MTEAIADPFFVAVAILLALASFSSGSFRTVTVRPDTIPFPRFPANLRRSVYFVRPGKPQSPRSRRERLHNAEKKLDDPWERRDTPSPWARYRRSYAGLQKKNQL